jgi:hypothetical protein
MRLTLLQRAVIQRLRDRGLNTVAESASVSWCEGYRLEAPVELRIGGPMLLRDFERANEQAGGERP